MIKMGGCQDSSSEAPVFQAESLSFMFCYSLALEPETKANFSGSPFLYQNKSFAKVLLDVQVYKMALNG